MYLMCADGGFGGEYKIVTAVYICLVYLSVAEKKHHDLGNLQIKEFIGDLPFQSVSPRPSWGKHGSRHRAERPGVETTAMKGMANREWCGLFKLQSPPH